MVHFFTFGKQFVFSLIVLNFHYEFRRIGEPIPILLNELEKAKAKKTEEMWKNQVFKSNYLSPTIRFTFD